MNRIAKLIRSRRAELATVSAATGIAADRLGALMRNAEPSLKELRLIAEHFGVRITDMGSLSDAGRRAQVLLRAGVQSVSKPVKTAIDSFANLVSRILELLPDNTRSPDWLGAVAGPHETYEDAERAALDVRRLMGIPDVSPLLKLPELADRELQVLVFVTDEKVDGASAMVRRTPFIFVSRRYEPRMLFTLAHEVGHLVAHHSALHDVEEFGVVDRDLQVTSSQAKRQGELYANAFAACLLLPRAGVGVTLNEIRARYNVPPPEPLGDVEILHLAHFYGVSFEVAARRCEDLDLLPAGGARALYDELKRQHKSPERRATEIGLPTRARAKFPVVPHSVLSRLVVQLRRGEVSIGRAAETLQVTVRSIIDLGTKRSG